MKAKKVVGRMILKKESANEKAHRWDLLPRLVCLILAVFLWLLIVNISQVDRSGSGFFGNNRSQTEQTSETE